MLTTKTFLMLVFLVIGHNAIVALEKALDIIRNASFTLAEYIKRDRTESKHMREARLCIEQVELLRKYKNGLASDLDLQQKFTTVAHMTTERIYLGACMSQVSAEIKSTRLLHVDPRFFANTYLRYSLDPKRAVSTFLYMRALRNKTVGDICEFLVWTDVVLLSEVLDRFGLEYNLIKDHTLISPTWRKTCKPPTLFKLN
jgi:hypothetical protein